MSEIKPWGYLITEHQTGKVVFAKNPPSPDDMHEYELTRETIYTAEQLAEAVAAERERCAKVCENERLGDASRDPTDISYGVAIEHCIQSIRSAAK